MAWQQDFHLASGFCSLADVLRPACRPRFTASPTTGHVAAAFTHKIQHFFSLSSHTSHRGGTLVVWSRWARTAPDDGHYGALDEYYGPYGVESGENPLYLRARGGAGGGDILSELAPRDALEASRVIESHRYDLFAATDAGR